jgi:hypothetical protein
VAGGESHSEAFMKLISVNCNGCGAPLNVGPNTRFVTCVQCGARLAVVRSESSAYTEMLEQLDKKTDAIAEQLAEIQRHNEVERIDREWELEKQQWMTVGKDGSKSEPNADASMFGAVIMVVFGILWMMFAAGIGGGAFALFGLLFIGAAVFMGRTGVEKAKSFEAAEARWRKRRAEAMEADRPAG